MHYNYHCTVACGSDRLALLADFLGLRGHAEFAFLWAPAAPAMQPYV
jgi:hypothetical protein